MKSGGLSSVVPVLAVAAMLRLVLVFTCDRLVADVLRYHRVGSHLLDVSWNPYVAPRLYPYPPLWMFVEGASEWLARHLGWSFAVIVKLPGVAADVVIVLLLARWGAPGAPRAAWLYALSPVALLITGAHGQFDALPLLCVLLALHEQAGGRHDRSALALAAGIALKSFPVLLLPVLCMRLPDAVARVRYTALAILPVAALLVPFAVADVGALRRELVGYGGVADFGWVGVWRGLLWLVTGTLRRSLAAEWPVAVSVSKILFLAAYAGLLVWMWRLRARLDAPRAALVVLLAFSVLYGALSAQYLLWVVPLGCLLSPLATVWHGAAAAIGLAGFYLFLAPGVMWPAPGPLTESAAGVLWVAGALGTLVVSARWLAADLRRLRRDTA
jgi:hypothetical protein